jgi:NAD(P)-dependent dehydrogenase (short-subunit alcohol dehydrogenase family)
MEYYRNKTALITGASSGIGRATALRLAAYGAQVALAARNGEALEEVRGEVESLGSQALVLPTDVTVAAQVKQAVERSAAHFGKIDVLVACAGLSMRAYFDSAHLEAMERVMRVNFFGTLYATHFALPHVKKSRGSLVAISSLTGKRGIPSYSIYGASKFAVQGLYEALALELAGDGVHVGVVSPAFVDTPLRGNVLGPDGRPWLKPPPPPVSHLAGREVRGSHRSPDRQAAAASLASLVCRPAAGGRRDARPLDGQPHSDAEFPA